MILEVTRLHSIRDPSRTGLTLSSFRFQSHRKIDRLNRLRKKSVRSSFE